MSETFQVSLNKDSSDELNNFLDEQSFNELKEYFPDKIDEIFRITKAELSDLKESIKIKDKNKLIQIIRKNLIEDDIDGKEETEQENETNATIETLTIGTKSEQIKQLSAVVASSISEKLEKYDFLTDIQKINIMTGITGKILNSGVLGAAFGGLGNGVGKFISNIERGEFSEAIEGGKKEIDELSKFKNILDNNMQDILLIIETNKDNQDNLTKLLNNPQAIEEANKNTKLENIKELKGEELTEYLLKLNEKVIDYDKKILGVENFSSNVINIISNTPEFLQKASKELLDLLLSIPFLGGILAAIMGYNSPAEALEGFGEELKYAKSTKNLISHGGGLNKNAVFSDSNNSLIINELKDKNLSNLKYKKLTTFFKTCKDLSIDYTEITFWYKLFNTDKIDQSNEKDLFELSTKLNSTKINNDDFSNKEPKQSFYDKLNNLSKTEKITADTNIPEGNTIEELQKNKDNIEKVMYTSNNFTELTTFSFWLDNDLNDLRDDISIDDLLSTDYKDKIESQIGKKDYKSVRKNIDQIRERLQKSGIVVDGKIGEEYISDITFGTLINPESDIYKMLYKTDFEQINEINTQIQEKQKTKEEQEKKKKEIDSIVKELNTKEGNFTEFKYMIANEINTVKFDTNKQTISIGDVNYNIKLKMGYGIKSLVKDNNNVVINADIIGLNKKITPVPIEKFAEQIYALKHSGNISLNDSLGEEIGTIKA